MDLMGRLLHDNTFINNSNIPGYSTVADLVRMEVLGRFVHECINWLERAEKEEMEGLVSDDRFGKGVQNVSFFSVLSFVSSEADRFRETVMQILQLSHQTSNCRPVFRRRCSRNGTLHTSVLALRGRERTLSAVSHEQVLIFLD